MKEEQVDEDLPDKNVPQSGQLRSVRRLAPLSILKKRGMKMDDHPQKIIKNQNEEVEQVDEAGRMHLQQAGFKRIKDKESGGPGVGKVRSDDEIKKESKT